MGSLIPFTRRGHADALQELGVLEETFCLRRVTRGYTMHSLFDGDNFFNLF